MTTENAQLRLRVRPIRTTSRHPYFVHTAAGLAGGLFVLGTWLLLVPWDLSEVDRDGRILADGGDENAWTIGLVLALTLVIAFALALFPQQGTRATLFAFGGCIAWALLFAWRVGTARTSGANLFLVPLVLFVIPTVAIAPAVVRAVGKWVERQRDRRS